METTALRSKEESDLKKGLILFPFWADGRKAKNFSSSRKAAWGKIFEWGGNLAPTRKFLS
jgi:hypothetical protein